MVCQNMVGKLFKSEKNIWLRLKIRQNKKFLKFFSILVTVNPMTLVVTFFHLHLHPFDCDHLFQLSQQMNFEYGVVVDHDSVDDDHDDHVHELDALPEENAY